MPPLTTSSPPSLQSLTRYFDDFEALECGDAREYIPHEFLNPPTRWWECRIVREDKTKFYMYLERPASEGGDRFVLSARRVGDDFYISQYESFPTEGNVDEAPTGRFCAVVRKQHRRGSHQFTLSSAADDSETMSQMNHSSFKQRDCGAEIRTVTATFPEPTSQLESEYVWDQASGGGAAPSASSSSCASATGRASLAHQHLLSHTRTQRVRSRDDLSCDSSYDSSCESSVDGSEGEAEQVELANQVPVWDSVNGCLMMKFLRKRVRLASSKNVGMYRADDLMQEEDSSGVDQDNAVYQFGKTRVENDRKSVFVLDCRNPVAPLQAFAIALSGFAFKSKNK